MTTTIAERLKAVREALGKTQKIMSVEMGLSEGTWQTYERGLYKPGWEVLEKLEGAGFSASWLLTGQGAMFNAPDSAVPSVAATQMAAPQVDAGQVGRILEAISKVYKEFGYNLTLAQLGVKATEIASDLAADVPPDASLDAKLAAVQTAAAMLRRQLREAAQNPTGEAASKQRA